MALPYILLFLAFGCSTILGQSYLTYNNCVPMCTLDSYSDPPISGGPPCMCRMDAFPSGCIIAPCLPGDGDTEYICQCTEFNHPSTCVKIRCDNGTTSYAAIYSSCPAYSVEPGSYKESSYPSSEYPSSGYPSSGYPSSEYPSSNYESYCDNYCYCNGDQPPDCDGSEPDPLPPGQECSCNGENWPAGCTLRPCQAGDDQFCECSPEFNGSHCYGARCTVN